MRPLTSRLCRVASSKADADAAWASSSSAAGEFPRPPQRERRNDQLTPRIPAAAASKSSADAAWAASSSSSAAAAEQTKADDSSASSGGSSGGSSGAVTGGFATYYLQNGVAGNCGTVAQESDKVVALPTSTYAGGSHCGQQVIITRTDNGKSVTATVRVSFSLATLRSSAREPRG